MCVPILPVGTASFGKLLVVLGAKALEEEKRQTVFQVKIIALIINTVAPNESDSNVGLIFSFVII